VYLEFFQFSTVPVLLLIILWIEAKFNQDSNILAYLRFEKANEPGVQGVEKLLEGRVFIVIRITEIVFWLFLGFMIAWFIPNWIEFLLTKMNTINYSFLANLIASIVPATLYIITLLRLYFFIKKEVKILKKRKYKPLHLLIFMR
jgi:hypothetical protein